MSTSFIKKTPRHYLPESFIVDSWETLTPYFEELESRPLSTVVELEKWLKDASELEAVISDVDCYSTNLGVFLQAADLLVLCDGAALVG
jgi:oligoendopeptidase F